MKRQNLFHFKKMFKKVFLLICLLTFLPINNSCYVTSSSRTGTFYDVEIISDPPGARIELDGNYVGDAPIKVKIEGNSNREFKKNTEIVANPIYEGQLTERRNFYTYDKNKIPERILIVMMTRAPNKYDIKINKK